MINVAALVAPIIVSLAIEADKQERSEAPKQKPPKTYEEIWAEIKEEQKWSR